MPLARHIASMRSTSFRAITALSAAILLMAGTVMNTTGTTSMAESGCCTKRVVATGTGRLSSEYSLSTSTSKNLMKSRSTSCFFRNSRS